MRATIEPGPDSLGHVRMTSLLPEHRHNPHINDDSPETWARSAAFENAEVLRAGRRKKSLWRRSVVSLAGVAAQARHLGVTTTSIWGEESIEQDRLDAFEELESALTGPVHEQAIADALREAEELIVAHWPAVVDVAALLLSRAVVSSAAVRKVVRKHRDAAQ